MGLPHMPMLAAKAWRAAAALQAANNSTYVGKLPGDQPGYWGPPSGFDFCERNYDMTFYVGELWCMLSNWMSLPVYIGVVMYVASKGVRMMRVTCLTYMYLILGFMDMFCAGMSHGTLRMPWTQAQEKFLLCSYVFFFLVMALRYKGNPICKAIILVLIGVRVVDGTVDAILDMGKSSFGGTENLAVIVANIVPIVSFAGMFGLLVLGRDLTTRLLAAEIILVTPAFWTFGQTDVYSGKCMDLPMWLHEVGHSLGAITDYFSLIIVVSLDPEVQKSLKIAMKGPLPFLFDADSARSGSLVGTEAALIA